MKRTRNVPQKRGYRFTPDSRPAFRLTDKGIAFVKDCNSKLGAIAEDENLPRPTVQPDSQSHRQMVGEIIDEFEEAAKAKKPLSKGAKLENLMNCSKRLQTRIDRFFKNYLQASDYDSKEYWWERLRAAEKADSRVIRKMRELVEGK